MKLLAPLAGAGLFARLGGPSVALLDAATFAIAAAAFTVMPVREPAPARSRRSGWRGETAAGVGHLWRHPELRRLVLAAAFTMLLGGLSGAAIFAVIDGLHRPPAFAGVLYAVQGLGSVVGGLISGPLLRRAPERWFAAGGIMVFAVGVALRALPSVPAALAASAAIGFGLPSVLIAALTAVQRETPDRMVGRVAATANTMMFVPNAIALAVGAGMIAVFDYRVILIVIGLAAAGVGLYSLTDRDA